MLLRSSLFPAPHLVHGFSTRQGGSSQGPFSSMNLGRNWGDEEQSVDRNFEQLAHTAGFAVQELVTVTQVHGARVVRASEVHEHTQADGIFATRIDTGPKVVGVRTADCVPLLLVSEDGHRFAALHSGWRGTVANIAAEGVRCLCQEAGAIVAPQALWAFVGPCIERDAFEVGDEVAQQFPVEHRARYAQGRWHVDLVSMVMAQLRDAGLRPERCVRVGGCTHAQSDVYFSYRRDGRPTGQMLSFVGMPHI